MSREERNSLGGETHIIRAASVLAADTFAVGARLDPLRGCTFPR